MISIPHRRRQQDLSCSVLYILSSTSPSSQTGGCPCFLAITVAGMLSAVNINTSTISNLIIISQLNHFTFVSALLLPVLRLNLTLPLRLQGLGTGGWLDLTRQDSPAIYNQLTKASRVFLHSLEEISYADFSARTTFLFHHKQHLWSISYKTPVWPYTQPLLPTASSSGDSFLLSCNNYGFP